MKKWACLWALICSLSLAAEESFDYDLHYYTMPGTSARTLICLHGYGDSYDIGKRIRQYTPVQDTIISFNFPDHGICENDDHEMSCFGTKEEILPAIHVLKKCIIEEGRRHITLYGMSAGGGALVNVLAALYENKNVGLSEEERKTLISTLEHGTVILDVPLKSTEEIIASRGACPQPLAIVYKRHHENNMCPIEVLKTLKGRMKLNIILYIEQGDQVLSNRDDALYVKRLKEANKRGKTVVIYGRSGHHGGCHQTLWNYYCRITK